MLARPVTCPDLGFPACIAAGRVYPLCSLRHHYMPSRLHRSTTLSAQVHLPSAVQRMFVCRAASATVEGLTTPATQSFPLPDDPNRKPKILVAGAGIGGLVLAVGLLKKGFDVQLFERDMTAIRGEGKYRGPIQVQSNALAALMALDAEVAQEVMAQGCVTGDRINGLCDGETGDWYVKFDTFHPAVERGLPVTRVISRVTLQEILAVAAERLAGTTGVIINEALVTDFQQTVDPKTGQQRVWAMLQDGRKYEGDVLVGADGIWSKIRTKLVGHTEAHYSEYTCYTGISDFIPADIDTVGYRVFLGNGQYFVSSDVGGGKMQWYGFHKEPAGGLDKPGQRKERLLEIFGHWCDNVTELIKATPEEDVLRRDIYDRPPIFKWMDGRVVLVGDSAHAMQPNLGQGGCMAIEDGYTLARDLASVWQQGNQGVPDFTPVLRDYMNKRIMRVSTIHGMAGMAAFMASTYKAYLGEGLGGFGRWLQQFKIPHPGRVSGQVLMKLTMPGVLSWVLGGNTQELAQTDYAPACRLADKPRGFDERDFPRLMQDDDALLRASHAFWLLQPLPPVNQQLPVRLPAVEISHCPSMLVGSDEACHLVVDCPAVAKNHALIEQQDGNYYVRDLGSGAGTWLNHRRVPGYTRKQLHPGDELSFGHPDEGKGMRFKVTWRHVSQETPGELHPTEDHHVHVGMAGVYADVQTADAVVPSA